MNNLKSILKMAMDNLVEKNTRKMMVNPEKNFNYPLANETIVEMQQFVREYEDNMYRKSTSNDGEYYSFKLFEWILANCESTIHTVDFSIIKKNIPVVMEYLK